MPEYYRNTMRLAHWEFDMYLSRVEIDVDNRRKIRDLTHVGAYHSWVEDSFPEEKASGVRTRKLWRTDRLGGRVYLLVVSEKRPNPALLEKYGVPGSAQTKDYMPFLARIQKGKSYRFKATLNPVHSVSMGEGKRGKVYPEITIEQQLAFLEKRAEKYGFRLSQGEYGITERKYEILRKENQRPVRLSKVTYEGRLIVIDPDVFRTTLTKGIGRKKAYGFGMMTVIPEVE